MQKNSFMWSLTFSKYHIDPKKGREKHMKRTIALVIMVLLCGICTACASSNEDATTPIVIEDAEQFSKISTEELKTIMGEPVSEESWINKTSKGDFNVTTLSYDKNSNHYEFIVADDSVVRLTIYSNNYWNGDGDKFSITGERKEICKSFNITLGENAKKVTDNNFTYKLSPVNDKVAVFDVQSIDSDTFGLVKITYNLNYFD